MEWIRCSVVSVPRVQESFTATILTSHPSARVERVETASKDGEPTILVWTRDKGENPLEHRLRVAFVSWRWGADGGSEPLPEGLGKMIGRIKAREEHWLVFQLQAPGTASQEARAPRAPSTGRLPDERPSRSAEPSTQTSGSQPEAKARSPQGIAAPDAPSPTTHLRQEGAPQDPATSRTRAQPPATFEF